MTSKIIHQKVISKEPTRKELYNKYLNSSTWHEKREQALNRDGYRCRLCNSDKKLNVHHRCYPKVLGEEPLEDLSTLCAKCHEKFHGIKIEGIPKNKKKLSKKKRKAARREKALRSLMAQQYKDMKRHMANI